MYLNHDELMVLSRGGRVPRAERPTPAMVRPERAGPGRLSMLLGGLRSRLRRRTELGGHTYLELEFGVEDEKRAGLRRR
jgi:hypothetical protein